MRKTQNARRDGNVFVIVFDFEKNVLKCSHVVNILQFSFSLGIFSSIVNLK